MLGLCLCQIQRREQLLQTLANHFNLLLGIIEPVQHQQTFLEWITKRLAAMMQHIFHSTKVHNPKSHFSAANFDEPDKILAIRMLQSDQMIDIVVFCGFEVTFDVHLVAVLKFHGSVGVEDFTHVKGQVFHLLWAFAFLEDECFGCETLLLWIRLLMTSVFFLHYNQNIPYDLQL